MMGIGSDESLFSSLLISAKSIPWLIICASLHLCGSKSPPRVVPESFRIQRDQDSRLVLVTQDVQRSGLEDEMPSLDW